MERKLVKDKIAVLFAKKRIGLLLVIFGYIVFEVFFVLPLPTVGVHSWNESVYLSMSRFTHESGNPFVIKAAYDPFRPDYNVGYLFYWSSYFFHSIGNLFFEYTTATFLLVSRVFSLIATVVSSFLVYKIALKLSNREWCAYVAVLGFLFSPLILFFGAKFQLEPFAFTVFLISWLLLFRHAETHKLRYGVLAFTLLGALIATRQIFVIYVPALLLTPTMFSNSQHHLRKLIVKAVPSVLSMLLGFLSPILLTQIIVPEYSPMKFQLLRLMESSTMASYHSGTNDNLIVQYIEGSLLSSLGLIFLFVPIMVAIFSYQRKIKPENLALLFGGIVYFIFAFRHNIDHMYHSYYFMPIVILSLIFVTKFVLEKRRKSLMVGFSVFLVVALFFSVWETTSFYGLASNKIYSTDCYGNIDSVFAGHFIDRFHKVSDDTGLLVQNVTYYSLVQSPAVYFYEEMPTFSYYDFYTWDPNAKEYEGFNYYIDPESFLSALQKRNVFILTVTPDVYEHQEPRLQNYIQNNFVFIGSEGVYDFHLNQSIFNKDPKFCKDQAFLILEDLENGQIAPFAVSQRVMDMSNWYRITKRTESLKGQVFNEFSQNFTMEKSGWNKKAMTVEISLVNKAISPMETIVSLGDKVNIRHGSSNDIYLEIYSDEEYLWITGVDISKFRWQHLKLTFVYDVDALRAEIYMNGVLMSNTINGIDGTSFSPISLPDTFEIKNYVESSVTEVYSIDIWNRALSENEITGEKVV